MRHLILGIALFPSLALASGGMSVDFKFDEDGKASPETTLPYQWNENWYSEFQQRSITTVEEGDVVNLTDSRRTATIDEDLYKLNFIGYKSSNGDLTYGFTGGVEYIKIQQDEFGFGDLNSSTVVYENLDEIEIIQAIVGLDVSYSAGAITVGLGLDLIPAGTLELDQDLSLRIANEETANSSSSHSMDPSYGVNADLVVKTGFGFDLGVFADYKFLPLTYDYAILDGSNNLVVSEVEQEETTTRFGAKVILGQDTGLGRPVFGFTQETVSREVGSDTTDETIGYIVVGLDKRF